MKNELTPYFEPPDEIVFTLPSRGAEPTQTWRVPIEPRMKITRGGEPRRDWPLLLQTGGLMFAALLLPLGFLLRKPAPLPKISTSPAAKSSPQSIAKIEAAPAASTSPRVEAYSRAPAPASSKPPQFTVPPCAPTR